MSGRLSYRLFGWLAIINFLLVVVPLFIAPLPPFGPGADLVAFNRAHRGSLIIGNYLGVLQLPVNLIVLVFIAAVVRQAEEHASGWLWLLVLGAGVCSAAVATVQAVFFLLSPFLTNLGQAALALLGQLGLYGLDIGFAIQALLGGVIAVATLRLRCLPAWLGYLAWIVAILSGLGTLGLLVTSGPLSATSPLPLFAAGFALPVWLLLLGIYWVVRPPAHSVAAAATP